MAYGKIVDMAVEIYPLYNDITMSTNMSLTCRETLTLKSSVTKLFVQNASSGYYQRKTPKPVSMAFLWPVCSITLTS